MKIKKYEANGKDAIRMDDEALNRISGGTSLYEEAEGVDRDSWLASLVSSLVSKLVSNDGGETQHPAQSNTTPLTSVFVGDYSSRKT